MRLRTIIFSFVVLSVASLWAADTPASSSVQRGAPAAGSAWVAILDNGFSIRYYRREAAGSEVRLYVSPQGESFVDVPASSIAKIQVDEAAANAPASGWEVRKDSRPALTGRALDEVVAKASDRHGIDPDLIRSVIAAESGFHPGAVSPKGAQGLMQLMPDTASSLGVEDALDPERNVDGGTRYLRQLLVLYKGDLVKALAAYNAGPERVEQYNGVPPYPETRAYVSRVIREFNRKKMRQKTLKAGGSQ